MRGVTSSGRARARVALLSLAGGALLPSACGGSDTGATGPGGTTGTPAEVFDESRLHQVELTMSPEDWQSIREDTRGNEWRFASMVYDGHIIQRVGVRPAGESSRVAMNPKMS